MGIQRIILPPLGRKSDVKNVHHCWVSIFTAQDGNRSLSLHSLHTGYLVPDNVGDAQACGSHHCPVPRGWQGLHSLATASLPTLLDFLCSCLVLGILDHDTSFSWHRW